MLAIAQVLFLVLLSVNSIVAYPFFYRGKTPQRPTVKPQPSRPLPVSSPSLPVVPPAEHVGRMTYYGTDGELPPTRWFGACGIAPNRVPENFAALNAVEYTGSQCGKCLKLQYQGRCTEAVMVDKCPGCPRSGLDVSIGVFAALVGSEAEARRRGVVPDVHWNFVTCGAGC